MAYSFTAPTAPVVKFRGSRFVKVPAGYPRAGRRAVVQQVTATTVEAFVPAPANRTMLRNTKPVLVSIMLSDLEG